jgi:outer membrane protein TolC
MERFFDVLLADKEFCRHDENLAFVYVSLDRLRQRHELGQLSDIDLLAAESEYQSVRRQRQLAENRQRLTRAALADTLNRPGELPSDLATPELPQLTRELAEVELLVDAALARNPALRTQRAQVEAARERIAAANAEARPRLRGEVEASAYSRDMSSNDVWRAGVTLEVPLYTGGTVSAIAAQRQAELYEFQQRLRQDEMAVRQAVLDLWLQLQTLKIQREEAAALRDYRDLYLERSRTVYEQEVKADLGDAMVRLTEAELAVLRADFETALAWERLDALTGGPVMTAPQGEARP